jgi:hypothetical protein
MPDSGEDPQVGYVAYQEKKEVNDTGDWLEVIFLYEGGGDIGLIEPVYLW